MSTKVRERKKREAILDDVRRQWAKGMLSPLSALSLAASVDREAKGRIWVSRVEIAAPPETDLSRALSACMSTIGSPAVSEECDVAMRSVTGEWIGHRSGVDDNAPEPTLSEERKYHALTEGAPEAPVIFYIHGGGFISGSPVFARRNIAALCRAIDGHAFAPRYRLAPKHTMPAQVVDVVTAYFSLLCPPTESLHSSIPSKRIIFAGDSSGGSLCLSLIAFLLFFERRPALRGSIRVNGRALPETLLPAGAALLSPFFSSGYQLPSFFDPIATRNDILPDENPLYHDSRPDEPGWWPSDPPREHWVCKKQLLSHPLLEPLLISNEWWRGSPPVYVAIGQERGQGATEMVLGSLRRADVDVKADVFENMCHLWNVTLPQSPSAKEALRRMGQAMKDIMDGRQLGDRRLLIEEGTLREINDKWLEQYASAEQWTRLAKSVQMANDRLPTWKGHAATKSNL